MKKRYGLLLFLAGIGMALVGSYLLVQNRQTAVDQAKAIVAKDEAGTDITAEQIKLKSYASVHMKVNVKYTLTGSYNRAVAEAKAKSNSSNAVYAAAQKACDRRGVDSIRQSQCVSAFIAANGQAASNTPLPNIADYTYQVIGPAWSFDLAGLCFIIAAVMMILGVAAVVHRVVTK